MISLYGIPNCDTVKRARAWLQERDVEVAFHDFKRQGVPADRLETWLRVLGHERLVNRQGTTWRKLDEAQRMAVVDDTSACALLLAHPSAIRRPVVEWADGSLSAGFDATAWAKRLAG
jgi:Spx/MgsR family transcriptional regulator